MVRVLNGAEAREVATGDGTGDQLWVAEAEAEHACGWRWQGGRLCRDGEAVPVPEGRGAAFVRAGRVNLAAFWRHMAKPVLASEAGDVWVLGASAGERAEALRSLQAPDFTLPDLDGRPHTLSDFRGRKVFLVSWASW